jgi:hypothetical protein
MNIVTPRGLFQRFPKPMFFPRSLLVFSIILSVQLVRATHEFGYEELLVYQGIYEYEKDSELILAASPKDLLLYAIIGDAKYSLRPERNDVFLNTQGLTPTSTPSSPKSKFLL